MDRTFKINEIIYRFRKAKGLTQRELAEKLHTTAKTISNWERNKNSVPTEMFSAIEKALDIDKEFLFTNYINPALEEKAINFFYCYDCKNILWSDSKASHTCCNKKLMPLTASPQDASHFICIESNPQTGFITFTTDHPQNTDHRIEFVAYVSEVDVHIYTCAENKPVRISFPHAPGGKLYIFCSKHGLFHDGTLY